MSEIIKMKGRLLTFDKLDKIGIQFPKDCEIEYPDVVPVVWNFNFHKPDMVLGNAIVSRDETGLICDASINNMRIRDLLPELNNELPIGGYFIGLKEHYDDYGVRIVDECKLRGIGVTLAPADEDNKLVLVDESEE